MLLTGSASKVAAKILIAANALLFWFLIAVKPQLNALWRLLILGLPILMLAIPLFQGILIFLRRKEFSLIPLKENSNLIFTASIFVTTQP